MSPQVQVKIRTQDRLHWTIHQNRQELIDACREPTKAINETKTESWKNLFQDVMLNADGPNMWKVIQGLNGSPDANSPNKTTFQDRRIITNIKPKSNVFIHHYARVSKLNMSGVNRDLNQQFKKRLNA